MVFFSIFEQLCSADSIFNINLNFNFDGKAEKDKINKNSFTLKIKEIEYDYELSFDNARSSTLNNKLEFESEPNYPPEKSILPKIYIKKKLKGKHISDCIHPDLSTFYKNFLTVILEKKKVFCQHIELNDIHVKLIGTPICDYTDAIIFLQLLEVPFKNVVVFRDI